MRGKPAQVVACSMWMVTLLRQPGRPGEVRAVAPLVPPTVVAAAVAVVAVALLASRPSVPELLVVGFGLPADRHDFLPVRTRRRAGWKNCEDSTPGSPDARPPIGDRRRPSVAGRPERDAAGRAGGSTSDMSSPVRPTGPAGRDEAHAPRTVRPVATYPARNDMSSPGRPVASVAAQPGRGSLGERVNPDDSRVLAGADGVG